MNHLNLTPRATQVSGTLALFVISAIATEARAELPPEAYAAMQREAPEAIDIEVLGVKTVTVRQSDKQVATTNVVVTARVRGVERTATKLKVGTVITITYMHVMRPPMPGASEVPILRSGATSPAFLKRREGEKAYRPAAGGYSFDRVPDERKVS